MSSNRLLPPQWFDAIRERVREVNDRISVSGVQIEVPAPQSAPDLPVGIRGLRQNDILEGLNRFDQIRQSQGYARKPGETLPRGTEMRPYRFCVQDVVLAIWAMQHRKDEGDILVDVFLTSEVYDAHTRENGFYDELSGAIAALLTILSEAYRVGAPLRIQFSKTVEGGRIPMDVLRLAVRHGIALQEPEKGRIHADEGRKLYLALTGFRPVLRQAISHLHSQGLMSPERAAYIVHHGVWSLQEVEGIILCSSYPDMVLSGDVMPEHRHLYQHVLTHSRLALLGGLLDRTLMLRSDADADEVPGSKQKGLDVEDDERNLDIRTNALLFGREYVLNQGLIPDSLPLPDWGNSPRRLAPGERLSVALRPRTAAGIESHYLRDLQQAESRFQLAPHPHTVALLVPFDFHDLSPSLQNKIKAEADRRRVVLMICPESTRSLDQIAEKKMIASRIKKD